MQVRDFDFDFDSNSLFTWNGKLSKLFNALSMTFPIGEKFFIQAVRHYQPKVSESLNKDVEIFYRQEAKHSREHKKFNDLLEAAGVDVFKAELQAQEGLRKIGNTKEKALAVTVILEQLTEQGAKLLSNFDWFLISHEGCETSNLWRYHATEELEHAHVAREVMKQAAPMSKLKYGILFARTSALLAK